MIPVTDIVYDGTFSTSKIVYPVLPSTVAGMTGRFVRIDNVGTGVSAGVPIKTVSFYVENASGAAEFGRLDVFLPDGSLRTASQIPSQTLTPLDSVLPVKIDYKDAPSYFVYIEYLGTAVSLAQEYALQEKIIAVSSDGSARTSGDGTVWTGPFPTGLTTCTSIACAGSGLFVAAGTLGGTYGLASSPDGINWTLRTLPGAPPTTLLSIRANPAGQLVAISNTGATNYSYTSFDGIAWAGPFSGVPYTSTNPAWLDGKWYITSSNGSGWKSSPDGAVWTAVTGTGSGMYQLNTIVGINGFLIAGGGAPSNTTKQVQVSSNYGSSFGSLIPVNTATFYVNAFAETDTGRLLSVGSGTAKQINYSDDYGATWTSSATTLTSAVRAVCWTPFGIFVGGDNAVIHRSTDNGATFTLSGPASAAVTGIAFRH